MTAVRLSLAARCSAPSVFAPFSIRAFAAASFPLLMASSSGVRFSVVAASMAAPSDRTDFPHFGW
jgi:hypothetical protein